MIDFQKLPKVKKIAQSGHTVSNQSELLKPKQHKFTMALSSTVLQDMRNLLSLHMTNQHL